MRDGDGPGAKSVGVALSDLEDPSPFIHHSTGRPSPPARDGRRSRGLVNRTSPQVRSSATHASEGKQRCEDRMMNDAGLVEESTHTTYRVAQQGQKQQQKERQRSSAVPTDGDVTKKRLRAIQSFSWPLTQHTSRRAQAHRSKGREEPGARTSQSPTPVSLSRKGEGSG